MKKLLRIIAAFCVASIAQAQPTTPIKNARLSGTNYVIDGGTLSANGGTIIATPSATLDLLGTTRGSVLYRGASGWTLLPPGNNGYILQSGGTGADPSWVAGIPGTVSWGAIQGTLSNQSDLQAALDAKVSTTTANGWFADPSTNGSFSASAWRSDLSLVPGTNLAANIATISALKATSVSGLSTGYLVSVQNYASANDGGGGYFYYNSASAEADNGGTVIAPNSGSGRWIRLYSGAISVKWFGARGDGVTDDSATITSALTEAMAVGAGLYIPQGTGNYVVSRQGSQVVSYGSTTVYYVFKVTSPISIVCDGTFSVNMADASTANLFLVYNTSGVSISGVKSTGTGSPSTLQLYQGSAVAVADSLNCTIDRINSLNMRGGVTLLGTKNVRVTRSTSEIDAGRQSGSHFAAYASEESVFDTCTSYQGTSDSDFTFYGVGKNNIFINCYANNYSSSDTSKTITATGAQGFSVDAGEYGAKIIGSYAYGFYVGFDVKNGSDSTLVSGCTATKNKIGIAVRLGDQPAACLNTTVEGCVVNPAGGNGNSTPVLGVATLAVYIQNPQGLNFTGNQVGVSYYDGDGAQTFLPIGYTNSTVAGAVGKMATIIQNNRFVQATSYGGLLPYNDGKVIYVEGASSSTVANLSILNNEFKLHYAPQNYDVIDLNYVTSATISGNSFSEVTAGTGSTIAVENSDTVSIVGNTWASHNRLLNADTVTGLVFSGNTLRNGVGGTSLSQLYFDTCSGVNISGNSYYKIAGGAATDGRWMEAVNITTFDLVMSSNQLKINTYGPTTYYSVNSSVLYTGADVTIVGNEVNGTSVNSGITIAGTSVSLGGNITLDAITGVSSNGMLTRNGTNSLIARTITGTANQITATNGDGVSGNPTLSITTNPTLPGNVTANGTGNHTFGGPLLISPSGTTWAIAKTTAPAAVSTSGLNAVPQGTITSSNPEWYVGHRFSAHGSFAIWAYNGSSHLANALTIDPTTSSLATAAGRVVAITADTATSITLNSTHDTVTVSNASPVTVNLPALASNQGRRYVIKNVGAGTATVDPNSTETIFTTSAVNTVSLNTGDSVTITAFPSYWIVQ